MRIFLSLLILLVPVPGVLAYERITNVYEAVVPLPDRSDTARNEAIKQGLEQVLVRYTGYSAIAGIVEVANELNSAQRYVIEYGVETVEQESSDGLGKEESDALWVRFNSGLIDELAHSLELPIWPTLRPTLSYVVVMDLWGEPHIPSMDEYPALYLHLKRVFNERGIAAKQISKNKLRGVNANDLWQIDQLSADLLKSRSSTDITMIVRLHQQQGRERKIDFLFMETDAETVIHKSSENLVAGIDEGINQYIDGLSTGLAFLGGADVELDLYVQILGMRSYSEYKRILNQIAGLEQVISVRMESATDQSIGYLIRYQSDQALLIESITEITGIQQLPSIADGMNDADKELGSVEKPIYFRYPNPSFRVSPEAMPQSQQTLQQQQVMPKASSVEMSRISEIQG